jgi:hypothetical protein
MSNTYGFGGISLADLVSAIKGLAQNGGGTLNALKNVFPPATTSTSPVFTAVNNLSTTGTTIMNATTGLSGLILFNPGANPLYFYSTSLATTPTLSSLGGAIEILPSQDYQFPSISFANFNIGLGALVATGSSQPLTILQFF